MRVTIFIACVLLASSVLAQTSELRKCALTEEYSAKLLNKQLKQMSPSMKGTSFETMLKQKLQDITSKCRLANPISTPIEKIDVSVKSSLGVSVRASNPMLGATEAQCAQWTQRVTLLQKLIQDPYQRTDRVLGEYAETLNKIKAECPEAPQKA